MMHLPDSLALSILGFAMLGLSVGFLFTPLLSEVIAAVS